MSGLYSISVELEHWGSIPWHAQTTKAEWGKRLHIELVLSVDKPGAGHTDAEALASAQYLAGVIARAALWLGDQVAFDFPLSDAHQPFRCAQRNAKMNDQEEHCGYVSANDDVTIVNDEHEKNWPTPSVSITVSRESADRWLASARELVAAILISDRKQPQRPATSSRDAHADAKAPTIRTNTKQTRAST